jgi:hypothetical protein
MVFKFRGFANVRHWTQVHARGHVERAALARE